MLDGPDTIHGELRRIRYLGPAHSGTTGSWHMRLTSVALVPLSIGFVLLVIVLLGHSYAQVHATLSHPLPALLMLLFIGASVYHMQLGMRTIIEDYVHGELVKDWCLTANAFFSIVVGLACVFAVCKLAFS